MNDALDQSFGKRLSSNTRDFPRHLAVQCDANALTYESLAALAAQLANALLHVGLAPGRAPRIGVLASNSLEFAITVAACYAYGFCLVPIPSLIAPDAQARMLVDADVGILFVSEKLKHKAREALSLATAPGKRIAAIALDFTDSQWPSFSKILSVEKPFFAGGFALPEWEANIIYSSGTTGVPKGITHTHHARGVHHAQIGALGFSHETQLIDAVNLYSNHGLSALTATLYWGGATLTMSKFSVIAMAGFYKSHQPSAAWIVPAVLLRAIADPTFECAVKATNTLKVCAGAPLSAAQKQECLLKWPGQFIEAYGQSETGIVTVLDVNNTPKDKLGSVGRVARDCTIVIVGEDNCALEADCIGEIAAHTAALMDEYHGQAHVNAKAFWYDSHGQRYKLTGDLGRLDPDGYLWLSGRASDLIISGGYNVYAVDIEAALSDHPAVLEAVVVGAPSRKWGETPVACVQLRDGAEVEVEALRQWANAKLGEVQRLTGIEVYAELPRGTMGKILKRQLREAIASRGDDYQQPQPPGAPALRRFEQLPEGRRSQVGNIEGSGEQVVALSKSCSIDLSAFRVAPAPRLIGGRHRASGQVSFPSPPDADAFEPVELPAAGTLWSFTVQRHAPKAPYRGGTPFVPFVVGYVELPGALIVESPLVGIEFDALRIGLPVELTSFPLYRDERGTDVLMFAFTLCRRASA